MNTFDKQELIRQVNKFYNTDVQSTDRYLDIVNAKKALCYYMRKTKKCTFQEIANLIGTHHTTVMHHVQKHDNIMRFDKQYRNKYNEFLESITPKDKHFICREVQYLPNFK